MHDSKLFRLFVVVILIFLFFQNKRRTGPFESGKILPGAEKPMTVRDNYGGSGCTKSSIFAMTSICAANAHDKNPPYYGKYFPFAHLPDDIIFYHRPGNANVIAIMHPTTFVISPFYLVSYI